MKKSNIIVVLAIVIFIAIPVYFVTYVPKGGDTVSKKVYVKTAKPFVPIVETVEDSSSEHMFGIDISQYQGNINWGELNTSHHPIEYIFVRATCGKNKKDKKFDDNWENVKENGYLRGAYHYYRPNENSTKQFNNFKSVVTLSKGDFPPVLDIEKQSRLGSKKLLEGVLNWLKLAEEHYGVKPILYTGASFYKDYLRGHVDDCTLWIAAYSGESKLKGIDWDFHQFSEEVVIKGVEYSVDGNNFKGSMEDLKGLCK